MPLPRCLALSKRVPACYNMSDLKAFTFLGWVAKWMIVPAVIAGVGYVALKPAFAPDTLRFAGSDEEEQNKVAGFKAPRMRVTVKRGRTISDPDVIHSGYSGPRRKKKKVTPPPTTTETAPTATTTKAPPPPVQKQSEPPPAAPPVDPGQETIPVSEGGTSLN